MKSGIGSQQPGTPSHPANSRSAWHLKGRASGRAFRPGAPRLRWVCRICGFTGRILAPELRSVAEAPSPTDPEGKRSKRAGTPFNPAVNALVPMGRSSAGVGKGLYLLGRAAKRVGTLVYPLGKAAERVGMLVYLLGKAARRVGRALSPLVFAAVGAQQATMQARNAPPPWSVPPDWDWIGTGLGWIGTRFQAQKPRSSSSDWH